MASTFLRPRLGADELEPVEPPPPEGLHINLAGNENPFGPGPAVQRAIVRATPRSCRYPFREEYVLKKMLAQREGVNVENIILTNGCDELLSMTSAALLGPGKNVVAPAPSYDQLQRYAETVGAIVKNVPHVRATMQHDLPAMSKAVDDNTGVVLVCNPDNPSGTLLAPTEVEAFVREVAERAPVFLDEVYLDLLEDEGEQTQVALAREGLPVVIGRSFSKMHALAGHRIGYGVAPKELAEKIAHRQMSSVNYLGVAAARTSLLEPDWWRYSRRKIAAGRDRFCALLDELGLRYTPSVGNFVFHQTGIPIREYQATMKEHGFLVGRPFEPYEDWCRISIGSDDEMRQFAESMRTVFASRAKSAA